MSQKNAKTFDTDDAAPLGSARLTSAIISHHRIRRKGPRSDLALLRRSLPKYRRALPDVSPGESGDFASENNISSEPHISNSLSKSMPDLAGSNSKVNGISIFASNIQCLHAKLIELTYHLEVYPPHVVLLQETLLNPTTEDVQVPGYTKV